MATYTHLEGTDRFRRKLQVLAKKYGGDATVTIGYAASYALRIHEDMAMYHSNGKAKFLEGPMRRFRGEAARIVREAMRAGQKLREALNRAGQFILRMSQLEVPIDTGFLKASGFVDVENR